MAFTGVSDEGRTWLLGNALAGATVYVGLGHTADVSTAPANGATLATITELATNGYARASCVMAAAASQATVGAQVTFTFSGTPTGGTATYWFLATTSSGTGGKILCWGSLATARTYVNADTQKVTPTVTD
jgi:hypothetical protein